jgi:hypothetical protein
LVGTERAVRCVSATSHRWDEVTPTDTRQPFTFALLARVASNVLTTTFLLGKATVGGSSQDTTGIVIHDSSGVPTLRLRHGSGSAGTVADFAPFTRNEWSLIVFSGDGSGGMRMRYNGRPCCALRPTAWDLTATIPASTPFSLGSQSVSANAFSADADIAAVMGWRGTDLLRPAGLAKVRRLEAYFARVYGVPIKSL